MSAIYLEIKDSVGYITLSNPGKKNAMNHQSWLSLRKLAREVSEDPQVRCVVIQGEGSDFCSGADLSDAESLTLNGLARMRTIGETILSIQRIHKPTIAKVAGVSVGAGMGIALACDLVVASQDARFSQIFAKRGLAVDGGSSWLIPRLVGLQKAKELAFFGEIIGAGDAFRIGLVNRVLANEELDGFVEGWARKLATGPTLALSLSKTLINNAFATSFEQALEDEARSQALVFTTEDCAEAIGAFLSRREPIFKGK